MACYSPIRGFRRANGTIAFNSNGAEMARQTASVQCGQCVGCRLNRSRQWAARIMHESQCHDRNSFLTLTYSDAELPPGGSLELSHWQNFAKRVRKNLGPFRFFHCGEYGEITMRAHYHAAIFGQDWSHDRQFHKMSKCGKYPLYTSESLDTLWTHGQCLIGSLTFESAAYVARYCLKKITGKQQEGTTVIDRNTGQVFDRKPEYATMSRRPGLGKAWFDKFHDDIYPDDYVLTPSGQKSNVPKFYDNQLEALDPNRLSFQKEKRKARGIARRANSDDETPERLAVRERVTIARQKVFKRDSS